MERSILGFRCKKCGTMHYPNRTLCKKCGNDQFASESLPTGGVLLTYTRVHNLAVDFDVPYLTIGIVELENGSRVMGQLAIDEPKIGMKVQGSVDVVRRDEYKRSYGLIFRTA